MTEYIFNVKCVKSFAQGTTQHWIPDKCYRCTTSDFALFRIERDPGTPGTFALYEIGVVLFHEYFEVDDKLAKFPLIDDENLDSEPTRFFNFVKTDAVRIGREIGVALSDTELCAIAYELVTVSEPETRDKFYAELVTERVSQLGLRKCG